MASPQSPRDTSAEQSAHGVLESTPSPKVRVWTVVIDGRPPATFDDLDVALEFMRGDIGTNGSASAVLESELRDYDEYVRGVEREDSA